MSHEFESGFFTKEPAWHRLGTVLDNPPTVEEAIKVAGLDWKVLEVSLCADLKDLDGRMVDVPSHKVLVRDRDKTILGVVGAGYAPYQNHEAFGWFNPLVQDGTVTLEAAGSLQGGRKVWILGRYADPVEVVPGDRLMPYVVLATGHDGAMSVRLKNTVVRVVCWNTMQAAGIKDDLDLDLEFSVRGGASFSHVGNVARRVEQAREWVLAAREAVGATKAVYALMASKTVDVQTVRTFAREVFDPDYLQAVSLLKRLRTRVHQEESELRARLEEKAAELEALLAKPSRVEQEVAEAFEAGPGHELAGSTVYGAFNAATHYVDHLRSRTEEAGLASSWFGAGAQLRRKAYDKAYALAVNQ